MPTKHIEIEKCIHKAHDDMPENVFKSVVEQQVISYRTLYIVGTSNPLMINLLKVDEAFKAFIESPLYDMAVLVRTAVNCNLKQTLTQKISEKHELDYTNAVFLCNHYSKQADNLQNFDKLIVNKNTRHALTLLVSRAIHRVHILNIAKMPLPDIV